MAVRKVLIYATSAKGLLVFDEPEFPHVALQVPGGTVEPDEPIEAAALREFEEETGLALSLPPTLIETVDYSFTRDGVMHTHRRSYFHVQLGNDLPTEWRHHEMMAFDGSPPIEFRFFWLPIQQAKSSLGYGMDALLNRLAGV